FAHMLAALDFYLEKPKEIIVAGAEGDPELKDLVRKIHSLYLPNKTLQILFPGGPAGPNAALLAGKTQIGGKPTAYVCRNFTCSQPVTEWDDLKELLEQ
ncbi:MAG: thioredoxin domain-containing protein, partial [Deltaproteobacteria bacterium]|nr:thioredoxin domain-containing protein [Deltaproteobacteria bacterium]